MGGRISAGQLACIPGTHIQQLSLTGENDLWSMRPGLERMLLKLLQRLVVQLGGWETAQNDPLGMLSNPPGGTALCLFLFCFNFRFCHKSFTASFGLLPQSRNLKFVCLFVSEGWFIKNVGFTNVDCSGYGI